MAKDKESIKTTATTLPPREGSIKEPVKSVFDPVLKMFGKDATPRGTQHGSVKEPGKSVFDPVLKMFARDATPRRTKDGSVKGPVKSVFDPVLKMFARDQTPRQTKVESTKEEFQKAVGSKNKLTTDQKIQFLTIISIVVCGILIASAIVLIILTILMWDTLLTFSYWIAYSQTILIIIQITVGVIVAVAAMFGSFVILKDKLVLILIFSAIIFVTAIVEFVIGSLALEASVMFPENTLLIMRRKQKRYFIDSKGPNYWDTLHRKLECCGADDPSSWSMVLNVPLVPVSCCFGEKKPTSKFCDAKHQFENIYKIGCWESLTSYMWHSFSELIGLSYTFALVELIGLVFLLGLCYELWKKSKHTRHQEKEIIHYAEDEPDEN